jgi:hypothetical protein
MRALIARDLADAGIAGLSADRRFATAYNAALQAANMAIACAGYRIMSKVGHHRVSLESAKLVLGKPMHKYADYFETCRRKRNTIDYTFSNVATETEATEILMRDSFIARSRTGLPRTVPCSRSKIWLLFEDRAEPNATHRRRSLGSGEPRARITKGVQPRPSPFESCVPHQKSPWLAPPQSARIVCREH